VFLPGSDLRFESIIEIQTSILSKIAKIELIIEEHEVEEGLSGYLKIKEESPRPRLKEESPRPSLQF
jgi:hypothetical protein